MLFGVLAVVTLVSLIPFTISCYHFVQGVKDDMPLGYAFPNIYDFKITACSSVVFAISEFFIRKVAFKLFVPFCKEQKDLKARDYRSGKAAFSIYKFIYFCAATIWGYQVLKNTEYLPWYMGGSGDFARLFDGYPYMEHTPMLKEYFLVTMGYHCGGLVFHFY